MRIYHLNNRAPNFVFFFVNSIGSWCPKQLSVSRRGWHYGERVAVATCIQLSDCRHRRGRRWHARFAALCHLWFALCHRFRILSYDLFCIEYRNVVLLCSVCKSLIRLGRIYFDQYVLKNSNFEIKICFFFWLRYISRNYDFWEKFVVFCYGDSLICSPLSVGFFNNLLFFLCHKFYFNIFSREFLFSDEKQKNSINISFIFFFTDIVILLQDGGLYIIVGGCGCRWKTSK